MTDVDVVEVAYFESSTALSVSTFVTSLLLTFTFRNIQTFNTALMGNTALFRVDALLSAPKIVLQPPSSEIYWLIMHCIRDYVESTKVGSS